MFHKARTDTQYQTRIVYRVMLTAYWNPGFGVTTIQQAAAALGKERGPGMIVINGEEIEDFWNQIDSA